MSLPASFRPLAALALAAVLGASGPASAKDLGVLGATWPIAEPDLLVEIEERLSAQCSARARWPGSSAKPDPAPGRGWRNRSRSPASRRRGKHRSRLFDPAIVVERDIRLPDGTLIAAAGTRVNPLASHALSRDLLFVDGRRDAEIAWALKHARPAKIVLLAGRPLDLARTHGRAFFFDQGGRLATRFGLRFTPALVEQAGAQLRITEIPVEDRDAPKPEQEE